MHRAGNFNPASSSLLPSYRSHLSHFIPSIISLAQDTITARTCLKDTMDGLSAAASGIAVVSLALQLVGSVREIRHFLHSISEAPEELKRLIDLLEQLELILEQVGMLAQRQRGNVGLADAGLFVSVLRAIKTCETKLAMLEDVVEATKEASASSNRVTKTLGSFKLASREKNIRGIEQQLNEAVNLLNLTMMANLT
jgi:hypothetical protein